MQQPGFSTRRILIADDCEATRAEFRRILESVGPVLNSAGPAPGSAGVAVGSAGSAGDLPCFQVVTASCGVDALARVREAREQGAPFAVAFVDMRMPGWDGFETAGRLWEIDAPLQVVLCAAYTDYSWGQLAERVGRSDQLLILKKPFEETEILQFAWSAAATWDLAREARAKQGEIELRVQARTGDLERAVIELEQQRRELEGACSTAESSRRSQRAFLANMSHEIRTPVNGVLGMIALLRDTELDREQREYVEVLNRSASSLMALLNDLLDLSKIEEGRLSLESLPFNLLEVVEGVGELMAPGAAEKGLEFAIRYAPGTPRHLIGDPLRLRQVLTNLVSNAIKFTGDGHVRIDVEARDVQPDRATLEIAVEDTGIGIPESQLDRIFERFVQAEESTTRRFGGTGLGLAIVGEIVQLMGGTVRAKSSTGVGSRLSVEVTLPRVAPREGVLHHGSGWAELRGMRALLAAPVGISASIAQEQLVHLGVQCESVRSADEALKRLGARGSADRAHDVLVVDSGLPGADPEAFAERLQAEHDGLPIPMVLLCDLSSRIPAERAEQAGYAAVLVKPAGFVHLGPALAKVRAAWLLRGALQAEGAVGASGAGVCAPAWQGRAPRVLLAEDNDVNQRLAILLLERMGCEVDLARTGTDAVRMGLHGRYDLVLMDGQMPGMDGCDATRELRRCGIVTPILALTANDTPEDRRRCLEAGMDDYLTKPISANTLAAALDRWQAKTPAEV